MKLCGKPEDSFPIDSVVIDDSDFDACFDILTKGQANLYVICHPGFMRRFLECVHRRFIFVKAAGGVVCDSSGKRLTIFRNGRYDLPKGKVEDGESLAHAALRETNEETGLEELQLGPLLLKTYHIYDLYGGWHFKQTSWFQMHCTSSQRLVPQLDEGITDCLWLDDKEWRSRLDQSYSTMQNITRQIFDRQ
ncbi:MAG: NUDIX domain-containing protein [Bacteroidales bacterium]|nr:NUDIX domain-containing protein [Bacteroidales bacterium]